MLALERKRTERSHFRLVLMLLESEGSNGSGRRNDILEKVLYALSEVTRETDIKGWYKDGSVIGVIFTEIAGTTDKSLATALLGKVSSALSRTLGVEQIHSITISFHVYPENQDGDDGGMPADLVLYPDVTRGADQNNGALRLKRFIDIVGSLAAIILGAPLFIAVSLLVKLTSKGPVLFRQTRLGQYDKPFIFLKFRSMYAGSDPAIHQAFVKTFISSGNGESQSNGHPQAAYKITADPRVTPLGAFLRKTSLDELPQFLNVLKGDMSLVGPRPPLAYEFRAYDAWHKSRLLAVKPGITGLWQVEGRSRVKFDEMVRMDLRYARSWSVWLDLKILFRTPRVVLSGNGAY